MMLRILGVFFTVLFFCHSASAQKSAWLSGTLQDVEKSGLVAATVVLLNANDSSIANYALSDEKGFFKLQAPTNKSYILQISYMGFVTISNKIELDEKKDMGIVTMHEATSELESVQVEAEHIPIRMRGDTLEFNAAAFNVQAHDDVEKLLEQMPGVEIDKEGNITVNGKKVEKILVDGKEFFGTDVKMALKNLPADAIEKIDIFKKNKEDEADTEQSDDETKTLNLTLKEDKKVGFMGTVKGGYGYPNHRYKGQLSLNYFNPIMRISLVGATNNVNEAGFSYKDYQDMSGGHSNFMNGNRAMNIGNNWDDPIVSMMWGGATGETRAITGGINTNFFLSKNTDLSFHYMYTNAQRFNLKNVYLRSVTPENFFTRNTVDQNFLLAQRHNINLKFSHKIDSTHEFKFNTNVRLNGSSTLSDQISNTLGANDSLENTLNLESNDTKSGAGVLSNVYYKRKFKKKDRVFSGNAAFAYLIRQNNFSNVSATDLYTDGLLFDTDSLQQQQGIRYNKQVYGAQLFYKEPLGKDNFIEFKLKGGLSIEFNDRVVKDISGQTEFVNDTMSDVYHKYYNFQTVSAAFARKVKAYDLHLSLSFQRSELTGLLVSAEESLARVYYFPLARFRFKYKISKTKSISFSYRSRLQEPSLNDLQPMVNNQNPLSVFVGNTQLNPSYNHSIWTSYNYWDQSTFSSFYVSANAQITQNEVVRTSTIDENFRTIYQPQNLGNSVWSSLNAGFSSEIKKVIKYNVRLSANLSNRPMRTNGTDFNQLTHGYSLSLGVNNKKKKIINTSLSARWSVNNTINEINNSLNITYFNHSYTAFCALNIAKKWSVETDFNINIYDNLGFENTLAIPIWSASISRTFLKGETLKISLSVDNIMNEDFRIRRSSWGGVIRETQENMLGRYFMLSLDYKINKMGGSSSKSTEEVILF